MSQALLPSPARAIALMPSAVLCLPVMDASVKAALLTSFGDPGRVAATPTGLVASSEVTSLTLPGALVIAGTGIHVWWRETCLSAARTAPLSDA